MSNLWDRRSRHVLQGKNPRTRWREYIIQLARECLSVPLEELKKVVVEWSLGFSFLGSRRWMDGWHKIRKRICLFIGSSALKLDKWKVFLYVKDIKLVTKWRHKSHLREGSSANLQPVRINTRVAWVDCCGDHLGNKGAAESLFFNKSPLNVIYPGWWCSSFKTKHFYLLIDFSNSQQITLEE